MPSKNAIVFWLLINLFFSKCTGLKCFICTYNVTDVSNICSSESIKSNHTDKLQEIVKECIVGMTYCVKSIDSKEGTIHRDCSDNVKFRERSITEGCTGGYMGAFGNLEEMCVCASNYCNNSWRITANKLFCLLLALQLVIMNTSL